VKSEVSAMLIKLERLLVPLTMLIVVECAPKTWPYMKTYDIWETNKTVDSFRERPTLVGNSHNFADDNLLDGRRKNGSLTRTNGRKAKGEVL
jgi:hypothetical protein